MPTLTTLKAYEDENGNVIEFDGEVTENIRIKFVGRNNHLVVASPARIGRLNVDLEGDNANVSVGANHGKPLLRATISAGTGCRVAIGDDVSATGTVIITAAEGSNVTIGDDCMIATSVEIRSHDGHPIFDIGSRERINPARSITIGNHVWIARNAIVLGGVAIGDGAVVGNAAVVTKSIPNNSIAVGVPAKVVRRNVAWERPNLATNPQPDESNFTDSPYWNPTEEDTTDMPRVRKRRLLSRR